MIRNSIIAIAATLAIVALPSAASAGGHHHGGFRFGLVGVGLVGASAIAASCYRYQWVETRYGLRRVLVNVCY
jgi:hypothetical protein